MRKLIENFSRQLTEALEIGGKAKLHAHKNKFSNVLVSGLGGSGIGGSIVAEICSGESTVPVLVNKDYFIPAFVNENSLVIISSYSGNTEETLSAMKTAMEKKAKLVCISSGGQIIELAKKNSIDSILIPPGMPPRACLGYSMTQLLFVLNFFGIIDGAFKDQVQSAIMLLDKEEKNIQDEAYLIAKKLHEKIPVIYSASGYEGVAVRFRQQINENSKELCWHHWLPEMNHNELVGWKNKNTKLVVVLLRNEDDYDRNKTRMEISKKIIAPLCDDIIEIVSKGNSRLERVLYHIHLGDWVSLCLAEIKNIDSTEVKVIDFLKGELSKKA